MLQTQPVETVVITVGLADRSYPIVIGDGILDDTQTLRHWLIPALANRRPVVVSQQPVIDHYIDAIKRAVPDSDVCLIADGEVHKTHATLDGIYAQLLRGHYGRDTVLVALGGGVIGDMTGFAAATYMRGVGFIQIPTTLLAQVDASVGGKTAINHPLGKNMIGAFYQPQLVCIDIATLATLPRREYIGGLAEVIKYGCIADSDFWHWCIANAAALLARQPAALQHAIHRSCTIKAAVVADDERESGRRALLNFGHTFGHAIELLTNFSQYTHGEAVAIGMAMAARYAAARGDIPVTMADAVVDGIRRCELPVVPPRLDVDDCLGAMRRDKKAVGGEVRLVLLTAIGQARVVSDVDSNHLRQWLRTTLAH